MAPKTSSATLRLKQDYVRLKNDPVPYVVAEPNPSNILEWYAVFRATVYGLLDRTAVYSVRRTVPVYCEGSQFNRRRSRVLRRVLGYCQFDPYTVHEHSSWTPSSFSHILFVISKFLFTTYVTDIGRPLFMRS